MPFRTRHLKWSAAIVLVVLAGCRSTPDFDPRYRPAENVLEVVAVLRAHIPDDTYRFLPARDFTGRNVYRSSLLRLESIEQLHADALSAGHMAGVIAFAKGRSFERMRAYDLAQQSYLVAADADSSLRAEALHSADVCDAFVRALAAGPSEDLTDVEIQAMHMSGTSPETVVDAFENQISQLETLGKIVAGTHHYYIVDEEVERIDVARGQYFAGLRKVLPDGDVRAVAEFQRVVVRHPDSKNLNRHLLSLADLYVDLAVEYAGAHPPEGLSFDPARFQELIDAGTRLYEIVANQDGTPEKLEASRRLEAFLAFALAIDNDRFTP
jgi:hypothetical protein